MAMAGASIAAAAALQQQMEEEQEMTYKSDDLNGWEFKILRSNSGAFNTSAEMNKALQEESVHGWELVEKFDNYRLRLKRPVDARRKINTNATSDPYRTHYGISDARMAVYVIAGVLGFTALLIGALIYFVN